MARSDALTKIAAELEAEGYAKGYRQGLRDARKEFLDALDRLAKPTSPIVEQGPIETYIAKVPHHARRPREGSAQERVFQAIVEKGGLRGVDVVSALAATENPVDERTVRTALSRLKKAGKIIIQGGHWFAVGPATAPILHPREVA